MDPRNSTGSGIHSSTDTGIRNTTDADIVVVGGGITGLTTAHFLARQGLAVRVLEAEKRAGGAIGTARVGGFQLEHGPNSLLDTYPVLHELFAEIGLADQVVYAGEAAKNRYIVRDGQLHALPMSPPALMRSTLFSRRAKLRLLAEPFIGKGPDGVEETLAEFVERRLGREFLQYAIDAFVAGVYAGVPQQLSVREAFPRLFRLEERYGSIFKGAFLGRRERRRQGRTSKQSARMFSFREGLQGVVDALAAERGEGLHLATRLRAVAPTPDGYRLEADAGDGSLQFTCRAVLLTLPAHAYEHLQLSMDCGEALGALGRIYSPPVSMVFFGYRQQPPGHPLDGFGFLVPTCEQRQILGTLFSSTLFPGRAPEGGAALTTFIGGARQPELARRSDDELIDLVRHDLGDLLRIEAAPDEVVIRRWEQAIPQYQLGHGKLIDAVARCEATHPGLYLAGNFRGGISVADCIEGSRDLATRISGELRDKGN